MGTSGLDFTLVTPYDPCIIPLDLYSYIGQSITPGASDAKAFDSDNSTIENVLMYDSITFQPTASIPYGHGNVGSNYDYINCNYCGRIGSDMHLQTPVDGTTYIDVTVPNHGLPLNLYCAGGYVFVSTGDYGTSGLLTSRAAFLINSIIDANTIRLDTTLANWNAQIAQGSPQHMYFDNPVLEKGGGTNFSTYILEIHWSFDPTHPTFLDSVYSDN